MIKILLKDKVIELKIYSTNRLKYEKVLNTELKNGQIIKIKQKDVLPSARTEVECQCDICGKYFNRVRRDVKETTICGSSCQSQFVKSVNPSLKIDMVEVRCDYCNLKYEVHPSKFKKQDKFFCSHECYGKHRKEKYHGDKIYNYQDFNVACDNCNTTFKTSKWYMDNKQHMFCTQECYWAFRKDNYKEIYYDPNKRKNEKETNPERIVREWLDANNIKYKQEAGFLRKYYVDFYLPDYEIIIEVNGDYWHVNPEVYDINGNDSSKKELSQNQIDFLNSKYEIKRNSELESYGFKVIVLWEKDIEEDVSYLMNKTFNEIKQYQN